MLVRRPRKPTWRAWGSRAALAGLGIAFVWASTLGVWGQSERRVALVIGNSAYQHTRALPNPGNDANAIASVLRRIGFAVTVRTDLDYRDFRQAVRDFSNAASNADIALIHFAGHGLELVGENWLLPVDARIEHDRDLEYESVSLASLLAAVAGAHKLRLVILDACRNNPLGERMALSRGTPRSVSRGLARIEPKSDILVAYSAKAGTVAEDGSGLLSPYAEALVRHLATPGLDVRIMLGRVRDDVLAATRRNQEPFTYGSVGGQNLPLVPAAPGPASAMPTQEQEAAVAWQSIKDTSSTVELEAFVRRFAGTFHAELASSRLAELRKQAPLSPPRPQAITCSMFEQRMLSVLGHAATSRDHYQREIESLHEIKGVVSGPCDLKSQVFSGPIVKIQRCHNEATYIELAGSHGGKFVTVDRNDAHRTQNFQPRLPDRRGLMMLLVSGPAYYCIASRAPMEVWEATSIKLMSYR